MSPVWLWAPLVAWMALIFLGSSVPVSDEVPLLAIPHIDKAIHTVEYTVLGFLIARLLARRAPISTRFLLTLTAALTLAYGVTDEIHQLFVPTRRFDPLDMTVDLLGGLLGGGLWVGGMRVPRLARWW